MLQIKGVENMSGLVRGGGEARPQPGPALLARIARKRFL